MRGLQTTELRRAGLVVALLGLLTSCGSTLGSIPFRDEGAGEVLVQAESGELRFWTELDATYAGELGSAYAIELVQDGSVVGRATCDPLQIRKPRACSERVQAGQTHTVHCRMACYAHVPKTGPTLIRARYSIRQRPESFQLQQANLVVKQ